MNFTYDVKDAAGHTASAAVTIVVADPPPISAADDYYTAGGYNTPFALTLPGSILANDGPANAGGSLRFVQVLSGIPPADGALDWINPNGTFHFTPARGFRGNATFTYSELLACHAHQSRRARLAFVALAQHRMRKQLSPWLCFGSTGCPTIVLSAHQ